LKNLDLKYGMFMLLLVLL